MLVSSSWLSRYLPDITQIDAAEISDALEHRGIEVKSCKQLLPFPAKVVVGRVVACEKHPQADRLSVCRVDCGDDEPRTIVCGASDIRLNQCYATALPGARLPAGKIRRSKLRGVESDGMLCAAAELERGPDVTELLQVHGQPGTPLSTTDEQSPQYLWDLAITPDRGDCLSVVGICRELASIFNLKSLTPGAEKIAVSVELPVKAVIDQAAQQACDRFAQMRVSLAKPDSESEGASKQQMAELLRQMGQKSHSLIVDTTNFVLFELGQPLHAFDYDKLQGGLGVRFAQNDEELVLLDETTINVQSDSLVITDDTGAISLAGIKGGLSTAISDSTTEILLEAAHFDADAIRGKARRHNVESEASYRFERGVDSKAPEKALQRAAQLIREACPDATFSDIVITETAHASAAEKQIRITEAYLAERIGVNPNQLREVGDILRSLDIEATPIQGTDGTIWNIKVPSHRPDISIPEDIVEEVARCIGYANIPSVEGVLQPVEKAMHSRWRAQHHLRWQLASLGYQETLHYSFVTANWWQAVQAQADSPLPEALQLLGLGPGQRNTMTNSLWANLLPTLIYHNSYQQYDCKLFEFGNCFSLSSDNQVTETKHLALALMGQYDPFWWASSEVRDIDFFDAKGVLDTLFSGLEYRVPQQPHQVLHPTRSAAIFLADQPIGWIGQLNPALVTEHKLRSAPILAEIDVSKTAVASAMTVQEHEPVSKIPSIRRDLSLSLPDGLTVAELKELVVNASSYPVEVKVFDYYSNSKENTVNVGVALVWRSDTTESLTDESIVERIDEILGHLKGKYVLLSSNQHIGRRNDR